MTTDTIAAIATGMTNSGIGIVRVSGEDAFSIVDKIYRSKSGTKKLSEMKSHTIHYGHIVDGDEVIDEVMVLLMRAPNSYTREDTIEIDCHGGVLVVKKNIGDCDKVWRETGRTGRIYKARFFEWKDRSFPGGIRHGCDQCEK